MLLAYVSLRCGAYSVRRDKSSGDRSRLRKNTRPRSPTNPQPSPIQCHPPKSMLRNSPIFLKAAGFVSSHISRLTD